MLFKVLVCLCAMLAVGLSATVSSNLCTWHWGSFGQTLTCPTNYVGTGACGSGKNADCNGGSAYTGLYCCRVSENFAKTNCYTYGAKYGLDVQCPTTRPIVYGTCGSGRDADCGSGIWTKITCCWGSPLSVTQDSCRWNYHGYGTKVMCNSGEVLTGRCGSGRDADCYGARNWHGIRCCPYN